MRTIKVDGVTYNGGGKGGDFAGYVDPNTNFFIAADKTYPVSYNDDPEACFAVIEALAKEGEVLILDAGTDAGEYVFAVDAEKG